LNLKHQIDTISQSKTSQNSDPDLDSLLDYLTHKVEELCQAEKTHKSKVQSLVRENEDLRNELLQKIQTKEEGK
jgi:prefoldin subunit 5